MNVDVEGNGEWKQDGSNTTQEVNVGRRGGMWAEDYEFDAVLVECEVSICGISRSVP